MHIPSETVLSGGGRWKVVKPVPVDDIREDSISQNPRQQI